MCEDLKVCGKRELYNLLRMRHKYQVIMDKQVKERKEEEKKVRLAEKGPKDETDEDEKLDRELEDTILRIEKDKKRQAKKDKVQEKKSDLRTKMSVIATTTIDNDEELYLSRKQWDQLRDKVEEKSVDDSGEQDSDSGSEADSEQESDSSNQKEPAKDSDEETDEEVERINEMAEEFEKQIT